MKNRSKSGLARVLGIGLAIGASVFGSYNARADLEMKTVPVKKVWIADGTTEYQMNVTLDSTQHPNDEIVSTEFDVDNANPNFVCTRAEIPDNVNNPSQEPNDFFYTFLMDSNPGGPYNFADPDFSSGESRANNRATASFVTGPQNVQDKELARYFFTVPEGTPSGTYSFGTNAVFIFDSTLTNVYQSTDSGGSGVTRIDEPVSVFQNHAEARASCLSGPGQPYPQPYCSDYDSDKDGDVDLYDAALQWANPALLE